MFGHLIASYLKSLKRWDVTALGWFDEYYTYPTDFDVVINCEICLPKDCEEYHGNAIDINSSTPHTLAAQTKDSKTKIIHISTNCVFKSRKGGARSEGEIPDATDWYGKTRAMGELIDDKNLTIRLSEIGPELKPEGSNLFNWCMMQKGTIKGYSEVLWNGITSLELAKQLSHIIERPDLTGILHLYTPQSISKYQVLNTIRDIFDRNCNLVFDESVVEDKTLWSGRDDYAAMIPTHIMQLLQLREYITKHRNLYPHYFS